MPPPITFSTGMDGTNKVFVSLARDVNGGQLELTNVANLVVDATPPVNPVLSLTSSNSSSATVSWAGYAAPSDLNGFRVFLDTNSFTSVVGRAPVSALGSGSRAYTYQGLTLDRPYYAAVVAVDSAGNSSPTVTPFRFTLPSMVPPPVTVQVAAAGPSSAVVSWPGYNTSTLLGFAGFRLYYESADFTSVTGLAAKQTLEPSARSIQINDLDRTKAYYFAVVGFNGNNNFNPNVTAAAWSDPIAGNISVNMSLGGPGQETVDVLHSITIVNNAVLTLLPGTTLRFAPGAGLTVQQGSINAN
ncbi:MAG: hypothetical protein M1608_01350, partial [Candidatus Omnitrophica bacterium]|nr:hypothetical protein [Candidatus Omnitrophota bacterium]